MHLQIWRFLVLYQEVSRGSRVVIFVLLSLISFASLGKSISLSTPPCKLLIKILSIWCRVVSQRREVYFQAFVRRRSIHFTLRSCTYHTRSLDCFPARLPSEIRPKYPWSGTWISLHQHYHHVRRIFSTDGHCKWPVHHSVFRVVAWAKFHDGHHPPYLRRWLTIQLFAMHG